MYGYFDVQSMIGMTKHPGGLKFTRRLIDLCHVNESSSLLYIGVGSGSAAERISELTACTLIAVDKMPGMVEAARAATNGRLDLRVGDAEDLPFPDATFDVVISESVIGFTDKEKSIAESHRVLKPGGHLGMNEMTWLDSPTDEMIAYVNDLLGGLNPETTDGWLYRLTEAGFGEISHESGRLRVLEQFRGQMQMADRRQIGITRRFLSLYTRDKMFRKSIHALAGTSMHMPRGFMKHFGYGLYAARR